MVIVQKTSILLKRRLVNFCYPLYYVFGRIFGVSKESLERSYVDYSNELNLQQQYQVPREKILLLVPHCLQKDSCMHKITRHIENCRQCGGCRIGDLRALQRKYGCHLEVATGGTLARQVVKEKKPQAVVAVACERDLSSGIMDIYPLPVLGVINERPFGPCFNTDADMEQVEQAVQRFLGVVNV